MNLTEAEIVELRQQANGRAVRADLARRARLILLLAEGLTWSAIRAKLDCNDSYIALWGKRFAADRLAAFFSPHSARPTTAPPMAPRTGPRASSLPNLVASPCATSASTTSKPSPCSGSTSTQLEELLLIQQLQSTSMCPLTPTGSRNARAQ